MSSALKQVIVNAIVKVSSDPSYADHVFATPEESRDSFVKALIEVLFPENPSVPAVKERKKPGPKPKLDEHGNPIRKPRSPKTPKTEASTESSPPKEAKKPGPKPTLDENGEPIKKSPKPRAPMSEEAKAAMVAKRKATLEAKKAGAGEAPASPEKTPKKETPALPASPPKAPKKAKAKAKAEETETSPKKAKAKAEEPKPSPKKAKAEAKATTEEPKPSPKKAKKPSTDPVASVNIDKFTPTQKKKMKEIVGETADAKDVLSYLNGLSNAGFHDKKLEDHFRDYAAAQKPAEEAPAEEVDLVPVEFDGESYAVNPETKRVYTVDENGNATPVGYVGMAKFEDMEIPEDDEDEEE